MKFSLFGRRSAPSRFFRLMLPVILPALFFGLYKQTAVLIHAADADLDTSGFNSSGSTPGTNTAGWGANSDIGYGVAIQTDGKIIVAGGVRPSTSEDFGAIRFNANGTLDTSFGNTATPDGKFWKEITAGRTDRCTGVAMLPDGKIILAGYTSTAPGNDNFVAMRLNPDGTLDTTFGAPNGYVSTDIASNEFGAASTTERATSVAVQIVGGQPKIVIAGAIYGIYSDFALVRYNYDGSLDATFGGGNGIVVTPFSGADLANSVAITPDNKIVAAGYDNNADFAVVRYNTDGSLDSTFDGDGKLTTDFGTSSDQARAVAVQTDGKILVGGYLQDPTTNSDFAIARYNANGSLDTAFSGDGKASLVFTAGNSPDIISSLVVQPNGKIVAGGLTLNGSFYDSALARFNGDGSLDSSFGTGGKKTISIGSNSDQIAALALQPDGMLVSTGYANNGNDEFSVARYGASAINFSWDGSGSSDWHTNGNWSDGFAPSVTTANVALPAAGVTNETVISASDVTVNNLTLGTNRTITVTGGRTLTVNGTLTMNGGNITFSGGGKLVVGSSGALSRTTGYVIGAVQKNFSGSGSFTFPVGTASGYTPVALSATTGTGNFTVTSNNGFLTGVDNSQSIARNWTLQSSGITSANVTLTYLTGDVPGGANESAFQFIRRSGATNTVFAPTSFNTTTNTFTLNGVNSFSDWTLGSVAPTAASVTVTGRVFSTTSKGVSGAIVSITDFQGNTRSARTNSWGYFTFEGVKVGQNYVFSARAKGYPTSSQVFFVSDEAREVEILLSNVNSLTNTRSIMNRKR